MALKKITGKDFKEALDALTPYGEGDVVWLKELGKTDGGTGLYLIVGWTRDLGFDWDVVTANGFTGDNDDYIGYKIGYFNYKPGIRYMLQDFDDFNMPYNLKDDKANGIYSGDVWDTDGYLSNEPSSWDSLASQLNNDAQGIWDTWGENGELDLMESKKKEADDKDWMNDRFKSAEDFLNTLDTAERDAFVEEYFMACVDADPAWNDKKDSDYYLNFSDYDTLKEFYDTGKVVLFSPDYYKMRRPSEAKKRSCSMQKKIESLKKNEGVDDDAEQMLAELQGIVNKYFRGGKNITIRLNCTPTQDWVELDNNGYTDRVPVGGTANAFVARDVINKIINKYYL